MDDRRHGIFVEELATPFTAPTPITGGIQVAVGIAPVNMGSLENPLEPQVVRRYDEAVAKFGMTGNLMEFPLCQVIKAAFLMYKIAPVVLINVLDPAKHSNTSEPAEMTLEGQSLTIPKEGILPDTVNVTDKDGAITYIRDADYTLGFTSAGHLSITVVSDGAIAPGETLKVGHDYLDPAKVTQDDILAGIARIRDVQPLYDINPEQIVCPGWSHIPEVQQAMLEQSRQLNRCFSAFVWLDIDSNDAPTYTKAIKQKEENEAIGISAASIWPGEKGRLGINAALLWPCLNVSGETFYYSAVAASHMAYCDVNNGGIPYVSPSNKKLQSPVDPDIKMLGACLKDGTPIIIYPEDADDLNRKGICTVLRMQGWKFWGNRTAAYPQTKDVKDVFIATRRMFIWWGNSFISKYFEKVDDPTNRRLIESVIDEENIRSNGFKAQQQIAAASISIDPDLTTEDILDGTITFVQSLAFYPPAETIRHKMQFDPYALTRAVLGQEG